MAREARQVPSGRAKLEGACPQAETYHKEGEFSKRKVDKSEAKDK